MNRIFRIVWSRARGQWQVAGETAKSRAKGARARRANRSVGPATTAAPAHFGSRPGIRRKGTALLAAALSATLPAIASSLQPTGGDGGTSGGFTGGAAAMADSTRGGRGGTGGENIPGSGGVGGLGGTHGFTAGGTTTSDITVISDVAGMDGAAGGRGTEGAGGGGGGGGGYGAWLPDLGTNVMTIDGIDLKGGAGGAGGEGTGEGEGADGGDGGIGLSASNGQIVNSGAIIGGNGGLGALSDTIPTEAGQGAVGVSGANLRITNSGTISGGFTGGHIGDEAYRAAAIVFTGGTNALTLQAGSSMSGAVVASGASDTLTLGGTANGTFNASAIGGTAQYRGFEVFEKAGSSTWTLSGSGTQTWSITGGTLKGDASSLGGDIGVADGAGLVFDQGVGGAYGGIISGSGTLTKSGSGTLTLTGTNTYTGSTSVRAGVLAVNGSIVGLTVVADGGTLGGSGAVGSTTVAAGGTLAPGNSIGTLTVDGDLTFSPGSTYAVETDPTGSASDLTHVTGTAHLAGSVVHVGEDGNYAPFRSYTILTADGGLDGSFDSASSNYAFLAADLDYGSKDVSLTLRRNHASFASVAQTANQGATANGLESLAPGTGLYDSIVTLSRDDAAQAFDALSGEVHASTTSVLQAAASTVNSVLLDHLRDNLDAGRWPGAPLAQAGEAPIPASALPSSAALPLWAEVTGSWQHLASDGNATQVDHESGGIFVGGDRALDNDWRVGGAFGYDDSHIDVDARDSQVDAQNYSLALYGGKSFGMEGGKVDLLLGTALSWHDIDSERSIDVAGLAQQLTAGYHAHTTQLFTELGYAVPVNGRLTIEPFAGLAWSNLHTGGFRESGGSAALTADSSNNDLAVATLGAHARAAFMFGQRQASLQGTLGWRHADGDLRPVSTFAFEGGQSFTVAGVPIARDTALVELRVGIPLTRHASAGVTYTGQFGGGNHAQAGSVDVRWRF